MQPATRWRVLSVGTALLLGVGMAWTARWVSDLSQEVQDLKSGLARTNPGPATTPAMAPSRTPIGGVESTEDRLLRLERYLRAMPEGHQQPGVPSASVREPADARPGSAAADAQPTDGKTELAKLDAGTQAALREAVQQVLQARESQQRQRRDEQTTADRIAWLTKELGINDYQQGGIRKVYESTNSAFAELWEGEAGRALSTDEKRARVDEIRTSCESGIKALLTADQWAKYQAFRSNGRR